MIPHDPYTGFLTRPSRGRRLESCDSESRAAPLSNGKRGEDGGGEGSGERQSASVSGVCQGVSVPNPSGLKPPTSQDSAFCKAPVSPARVLESVPDGSSLCLDHTTHPKPNRRNKCGAPHRGCCTTAARGARKSTDDTAAVPAVGSAQSLTASLDSSQPLRPSASSTSPAAPPHRRQLRTPSSVLPSLALFALAGRALGIRPSGRGRAPGGALKAARGSTC